MRNIFKIAVRHKDGGGIADTFMADEYTKYVKSHLLRSIQPKSEDRNFAWCISNSKG